MPARVAYCQRRADKLREDMGLKVPIDVHAAAGRLGFEIVQRRRLREDALLAAAEKTIYVKSTAPSTRKRFSIAHEIGHYVLDHERERLDRYEEETLSGAKVWEAEANYFASALLMPAKDLSSDVAAGLDREALCHRYVVSPDAMVIRLTQLRLA